MTLEEAIGILEKDIHTDPPKSAITARKHDKAILMKLLLLPISAHPVYTL